MRSDTPDTNISISNITSTSFVNFKNNEPINLDLNKFISGNDPNMTMHDISSSNDLPLIQEVLII
jgi:hypothetical protein